MDTVTAPIAPTRTSRAPLLLGLAGTVMIVVPPLVELVSYDFFAGMGLALLLVLVALPGLRRLQQGRDGRPGAWGLRLMVAGLATIVVLVLGADLLDAALSGTAQSVAENVWTVLAGLAALSALVGVVLFSTGLTRARVVAPSGIWLFLAGMVGALMAESFEQSLDGPVPWLADLLPPLGFVLAGVGLLLLAQSAAQVQACQANGS